MDQKTRCQSCGMPLGQFKNETGQTVTNFGTNQDGSFTQEYCMFCFQKGMFTKPDQTLEEMIDSSVENMTKDLGFSEEKARNLANSLIPHLKRWKKVVSSV